LQRRAEVGKEGRGGESGGASGQTPVKDPRLRIANRQPETAQAWLVLENELAIILYESNYCLLSFTEFVTLV
jgi:hypothetical protein